MNAWKCNKCGYEYGGPQRPCPECSKAEQSFAEPTGSVDRLKQYVTSAWVEAEAVCVDAKTTGPSEVMMIFKARDMLREVLGVLNASPPNDQAQRP